MKTLLFFIALITMPLLDCKKGISESIPPKVQVVKNILGQKISIDSLDTFLELRMKELKVPGLSLAIINDGKLVYHAVKGFADVEQKQKVTDKTIFEAASLSKPLFAHFVMTFVEDGTLDLDKPLYQYLANPAIEQDERYKKITARMVLSHSTGFPNWRTDNADNQLSISFEPGTKFGYSGEAYEYLAEILAHLLNTNKKGLEVIYQQRIAVPLNLKITKYIQDENNFNNKALPYRNGEKIIGEKTGHEFNAAYSMHTEAKDFSKWMIALLNKKGLKPETYQELFSDQNELPLDAPQRQQGITNWTLGFAKAMLPFGTLYGHGGNNIGYTSLFGIERTKKWGFVIFTNADQSSLPLEVLLYLNTPK